MSTVLYWSYQLTAFRTLMQTLCPYYFSLDVLLLCICVTRFKIRYQFFYLLQGIVHEVIKWRTHHVNM